MPQQDKLKTRGLFEKVPLFCLSGCLLGSEGVAIGAGGNGGVLFVSADHDLIQGAVVLVLTMVGTLLDGAFDALVGMTVHRKASFEFGFGNSMVSVR